MQFSHSRFIFVLSKTVIKEIHCVLTNISQFVYIDTYNLYMFFIFIIPNSYVYAYSGVSTTVEPFWDISLNINTSSSCESTVIDGNEPPILSLIDCLEQFTKSEDLGSASKIKCAYCNENQESTKQITMKKLPIILCLHLKVTKKTKQKRYGASLISI